MKLRETGDERSFGMHTYRTRHSSSKLEHHVPSASAKGPTGCSNDSKVNRIAA